MKLFYCYSRSLRLFINSFGINYIATSKSKVSNKQFWTFAQSERLSELIALWTKLNKEEGYGKNHNFKD